MKNITIKREIRKKIHDYSEYGESVDETITRLINKAKDITEVDPILTGSTSVNIHDETYTKLVSMKSKESESFSSVLERILIKIDGK